MLLKDEIPINTTLLSVRSKIEILNPNEPENNTTSDAKKSPLALLAATCNKIGKDVAPSTSETSTTRSDTTSSQHTPSPRHSFEPYFTFRDLPARQPSTTVTSSSEVSKLTDARLELAQLQAKLVAAAASHGLEFSKLQAAASLYTRPHGSMLPLPGLPGQPATFVLPGGHQKNALGVLPYVGYVPVKLAQSTALVPICREAFCTSCQAAVKMAASSTYSRDCCTTSTQDSLKSPLPLPLSSTDSILNNFIHHPLFAAAALAQSDQQREKQSSSPSTVNCNWVSDNGSTCGKSFTSIDELMKHIRTQHTEKPSPSKSVTSASSTETVTNPLASLVNFSKKPSLIPSSAPTQSLSSLANVMGRYHPYPKVTLPPTLPVSGNASGLGAYYPYAYPSPYLLYDIPRA